LGNSNLSKEAEEDKVEGK